jgi:AmmeMemoRadiSam system protein B
VFLKIRFTFLLVSVFALCVLHSAEANAEKLRSPFEKKTEEAVKAAPPGAPRIENPDHLLGGIAPHHDLALPMIIRFYQRLAGASEEGRDVRRVWLLAPDHFRRVRNLAAVCSLDWALSTRTLEADEEARKALESLSMVEAADETIFAPEHGITIHIPLIARYFPNAKVVPVLLNPKIPDVGLIILRNKILELFRSGDVVILSMDLSHYKTPEAMAAEDEKTLPVLTKLRFGATGGLDVDARRAAALVLMLFRALGGGEGRVLERMDTSDILGRRLESGTSYATVIYGK